MPLIRVVFLLSFVSALQAAKFSLPIIVNKLPANSEFVVVHTAIDFTELLRAENVTAPVDERSLRLFEIRGDKRTEIPYQFTAAYLVLAAMLILLSLTKESREGDLSHDF